MSSILPYRTRRNSSTRSAGRGRNGSSPRGGGRGSGSDAMIADSEVEVGALGLLMYQAAREGSGVGLRFALSCRGANDHINYQDSTTQMTPLMVAAANGHLHCVKLLLAHLADINFAIPGPKHRSSKQTAISLATKNSHTRVVEYLQGCLNDMARGEVTRATLEAEINAMADNPQCTAEDVDSFQTKLCRLLDHCGYTMDSEDEEPSLLIRAAKADNQLIVKKLIEEFGVNPTYSTHPETAENALHFACRNTSSLRFYLISSHRELLCIPDRLGNSPLHIVCDKNDIEFISRLFHGVLGEGERRESLGMGTSRSSGSLPRCSVPSIMSMQRVIGAPRNRAESHAVAQPSQPPPIFGRSSSQAQFSASEAALLVPAARAMRSNSHAGLTEVSLEEVAEEETSDLGSSPTSHSITFTIPEDSESSPPPCSSLPVSFIADMKLFRKNIDGESILHILACRGHAQLLATILKVAERLKHIMGHDELSVVTERDGFTLRTPIEEGLMVGNLECVRLLLDFAENVNIMKKLFRDPDLMKVAVLFDQGGSAKNMEALKMLICYGFKTGLGKSVTLADLKEQRDVTRLLLFYQTQVVNALEFATVHQNNTVSIKTGHIKWEGFNLRHLDGEWFHDANCAIDTVSRLFHDPDYKVHMFFRQTQAFFRRLGASCLAYFSSTDIPLSLERSYVVPLVEINLTENHLVTLPPELFQQRHLRTLRLSHNELTHLPSSGSLHQTLYNCPRLRELDLDWNQLQTLPEEFCRGVGNSLEQLNVVHNRLTELPPGLWVMRQLRKLKLNSNSLSRLHWLSDPKCYVDPGLSRKVVMSFEVGSDGSLRVAAGSETVNNEEEIYHVKRYLENLMAFLKTAMVLLLERDDPDVNLVREVINLHWERYKCAENASYEPQLASNSIVNLLFDRVEEEGNSPLIQQGFTSLEELHLDQNCFTELPWDLPCLAPRLKKFFITENNLTDVDIVRGSPSRIMTICLSKNQIVSTAKRRSVALPCASFLFLLSTQPDRTGFGDYCAHCQHSSLETLAKLTLDSNHLESVELVDISSNVEKDKSAGELLDYASITIRPLYPFLTFLNLAGNFLTQVPRSLEKFSHLSYLNLSGNAGITVLPEEMGMLNPQVFLTLGLNGLFIKNIPHSIIKTGVTRNIICYLKSIREKSQTYRRIKLMVVGEDDKGKTSLLLCLTKAGHMVRFKEVAMNHNHQPLATNGVDLGDWEYAPKGKEKVTFMTWDFGGQEEYYATHQCFLTNRSLFLLVWNALDGEAGLRRLRFWLENIEVRARDSPVIVVATHADSLPQANFKTQVAKLKKRMLELYSRGPDSFAYPRICSELLVVSCKDNRHMDQLRNYIYSVAVNYCPPSLTNTNVIRPPDMEPLLQQKVPETFVKLQDIVRRLAQDCSRENRAPILTRQEYLKKVRESGEIHVSNDELDQATTFLHSNGILVHYSDSQLSDLYFVDPQWLCSSLANVITIRERNPHVKDGIISAQNLQQILRVATPTSVNELISVMRKFEVMFKLDDNRYLIPSLLPISEETPFVIMPHSTAHSSTHSLTELRLSPPAPILSLPDVLVRYLILPFIPNGFFSRLIARVINSDLATQIQTALVSGPLDSAHLLNQVHWECWRTGVSLIWNHVEVLRIATLNWPLPLSCGAAIVSSLPLPEERDVLKGMEIMVGVLPESKTLSCPAIPTDSSNDQECVKSRCMATWVLQKATELAETVMEDWYEVFGFRRNLNNLLSCIASVCPLCFKTCHSRADASSTERETTITDNTLYMFSLPFCCLQSNGVVTCPRHGVLKLADVAPDLVFADFSPVALIPEQNLKLLQRLGEGGFAKVYQGLLTRGTEQVKVAVKELQPSKNPMDATSSHPELEAENASWTIYHEVNIEARMMYQLNHPHILGLLGITLHPVRLVLELAREDLASTVSRYQKKNKKFNRRTLKSTLTQIADAMAYLHSKNILFRDLKPGNVLVWDFPLPHEQWNPEAQVLVKLADYGISKQISPQGIHSKAGTPQYLPPEVLLYSEHEAASLKVDVYSFGMVMYYLFCFANPFESSLLVGSQLRQGKRPELQTKFWPNSVQMVELMAWCWSDKPQQRPSFDQILSLLREETIYSLVGGIPLNNKEEVYAACVKTIAIPHRRHSTTFSPTLGAAGNAGGGHGQSCTRLSSVIPSRACGIGMETGVEVWYGTKTGKLNVVRYHSTRTYIEEVSHPSKDFISSIVTVRGNVWVATCGGGLWVYDPANRQPLAMWGETEKEQIFQLIPLEDAVMGLTDTGMYLFPAEIKDSMSSSFTILEPTVHSTSVGAQNTVGVFVPLGAHASATDVPEVWVCAQKGEWLQVLSSRDLSVKVEIEIPASDSRKIRHMATATVGEGTCVFLTNRHVLVKYSVKTRCLEGTLDCHSVVNGNDQSDSAQLRRARITSLVAGDDGLLYVGNAMGIILLIRVETLECASRLKAYDGPARCLQMMPMSGAFSRLISSFESTGSMRPVSSTATVSTATSTSSFDSVMTSPPLFTPASPPVANDDRSVLLTLGVGYKGVVAEATNHPSEFLLPHGLVVCPCCTHFLTKPRPVPSSSYLLLWSRETHPPGFPDTQAEHLDSSSE